jgi:hypothetical protein
MIFEFKYIRYQSDSSKPPETIYIKEWNKRDIKVQFDFKKPLEISTGIKKDKMSIKVRPEAFKHFASSDSGVIIEQPIEMSFDVPKQLPKGMT